MQVWLSGVRSQTHLVYASSWLRQSAPVNTHVGVIDAGGFVRRGIISADAFERWLGAIDGISYSFVGRPEMTDAEQVYIAIGSPGIKPLIRLRLANRLRRLRVVAVDEGIGSYGDFHSLRAAFGRQGNREPKRTIRAVAVQVARLAIDERWPLYLPDGQSWRINPPVADEFRRADASPEASDSVVYLSQPWPELGVVSKEGYLDHLQDIAAVVAEHGLRFLVKPHPIEDVSLHRARGIQLLDSDTPAELEPLVLGARAALGYTSTALLNMAAIHALPAFRVGYPELAGIRKGLTESQASLLHAFLPDFVTVAELANVLRDAG